MIGSIRGGIVVSALADPVALALERVGRQCDPAVGAGPTEAGPVDVQPGDVQRRDAVEQLLAVVAPAAQRRGPCPDTGRQAGLAHPEQHRMRADLDERVHTHPVQCRHPGGELHRLSDVTHPVLRVGQLRADRLAGHVGDHSALRRAEGDRRGDPPELVQHRLHQRRVERVRHRELLHSHTPRDEPIQHRPDRAGTPRHHHMTGTVHRRDGQRARQRRHRRRHLGNRREHRRHRPASAQRLHQPAARGNQPQPVLDRHHARHHRRHQLPQRMAQQRLRYHAPRTPQLHQTQLHGEQRRLRIRGLIHQPRQWTTRLGEHHAQQRLVEHALQQLRAPIDHVAEHRLGLVQAPSHPYRLRPLPGEQERHLRRVGARHHTGSRSRARLLGPVRVELRLHLRCRARDEGESMGEVGAAGIGRRAHIGQRRLGMPGEVRAIATRQCAQRRLGLRRQGQKLQRAPVAGDLGRRDRRCFEHQVRVGAAEPESADPGDAPPGGMPGRAHGRDDDRHRGPVDVRVRLVEVQVRRDLAVLEDQHGLDQPGHAGDRFEMADVRLDRADRQGRVRRCVPCTSAAASACTSIGSPSAVPVPWAST